MSTSRKAAGTIAAPRARARRAVSESDKAARRSAILEAAEQHLRGAGFEAFSMEVLGRQLGVARGTLYRYFATREAILLELYLAQRATFFASMMADVRPGMNDDEFLACWYRHATSDALLLVLQARLGSVIEHNIAPEHLLAAKLDMQRELDTVADHLADCLSLEGQQGQRLIAGLVALLLGAAELDNAPRLNGLPPHLSQAMALFGSRRVFTDNARLILQGLRREPVPR